MASTTAPIRKQDYEVLDDNAREIGGVKVTTNPQNKRIVKMSLAQAQYFLDQGKIKPL